MQGASSFFFKEKETGQFYPVSNHVKTTLERTGQHVL